MYRPDDMHGSKKNPEGLQWFAGAESPETCQSMLWRRSRVGSPLLFKKIKLLLMGEKYFPGFELFSKGHLQSCKPLKELSQKLCESVYMS